MKVKVNNNIFIFQEGTVAILFLSLFFIRSHDPEEFKSKYIMMMKLIVTLMLGERFDGGNGRHVQSMIELMDYYNEWTKQLEQLSEPELVMLFDAWQDIDLDTLE
jgi:hypothetical protein